MTNLEKIYQTLNKYDEEKSKLSRGEESAFATLEEANSYIEHEYEKLEMVCKFEKICSNKGSLSCGITCIHSYESCVSSSFSWNKQGERPTKEEIQEENYVTY